MTIAKVDNLLHSDLVHEVTFIHAGFDEPKALHERFGDGYKHVFISNYCSKAYRKHFSGSERILIKDGFEKDEMLTIPILSSFQIFILIMKKRV